MTKRRILLTCGLAICFLAKHLFPAVIHGPLEFIINIAWLWGM